MRNGSGTYSLPAGNPVSSGTTVSSTWANNTLSDIAAALTASIAKDGQTTPTANLPMGGFKLSGLGAGTSAGDSLRFEQLFSQGQPADVASAATTDIGAQNTTLLNITGTTSITSLGANYNGPRFLRFDGILTLTHSATLVLPGSANITTAAGDSAIFAPLGSPAAGWRCVIFSRAAGLYATAGPLASSGITGAAASGANPDITSLTGLTSIPNGTVTNLPSVTGTFKNLAVSATGSSANVSVSADEIVLSNASNQYVTLRTVSLTIAGTSVGANALDAGTIATGTWYSVWVIWDGTTTAGLLSLSATAPTLPSGYTHKARVGWVKTDGSGNKYPLAFKQYGRKVRYTVAGNVTGIPVVQGGAAAGSAVVPTYVSAQVQANSATTGLIPSTAFVAALNLSERGGSSQSICAPTSSYGAYNSTSNPPPMIGGVASVATSVTSVNYDMILESINVYFALGSVSSYLYLTGWEDNI